METRKKINEPNLEIPQKISCNLNKDRVLNDIYCGEYSESLRLVLRLGALKIKNTKNNFGIHRKGYRACLMKAKGHSYVEISKRLNVSRSYGRSLIRSFTYKAFGGFL